MQFLELIVVSHGNVRKTGKITFLLYTILGAQLFSKCSKMCPVFGSDSISCCREYPQRYIKKFFPTYPQVRTIGSINWKQF